MTGSSHNESQDDILGRIMDEFMDAVRDGRTPPLTEYVRQYPGLEQDIRDLLPLVSMVEHAPPTEVAGEPQHTHVPNTIGDYEILSEIGRGGMGVVYRARHVGLGREVALKVLPRSVIPDEHSRERFQREARAAAQLHHTNIVPVFEVGQDGDVLYYAMQFIPGRTLDEVQHELRRLRSGEIQALECAPATQLVHGGVSTQADPVRATDRATTLGDDTVTSGSSVSDSGRASFRGIAEVGIQAAEALQHAHERGIVHRDVKPGNLLVDPAGVVWLADFGLAKTEDDGFTRTGQLVGTVRYMSPERFVGDCDHLSDIYSLGATLYELLTLRPAFDVRDRLQLIEQIGNRDPVRPREIDRRIPVDLETIVLKAMEKEPRRRYSTARELADDLRRFRDGEPIHARSITVVERAVKWARRRPAVSSLIALVLLVGTVGFSFAGWKWAEAIRERDERTAAQLRAEANLLKAREAVNTMLTRVGDQRLRNVPQMEKLREQLLEDALTFNQSLVQMSNDPAVRADTGRAHLMLADIYLMLGRTSQARSSFDEAIKTLAALCREYPESTEYPRDLASARVQAAAGCESIGDDKAALAECNAARELLTGNQLDDRQLDDLATCHHILARIHRKTGATRQAEDAFRSALAALDRIRPAARTAPQAQQRRVEITSGLGDLLSRQDRVDQADEQLDEMLRISRQLVADSPRERKYRESLAAACLQVADFRRRTGRRPEARDLAKEALATRQQLTRDFPHIPDYRSDAASAMVLLAITFAEDGRYDESHSWFRDARDEMARLAAEFPLSAVYQRGLARHTRILGTFYYNSRRLPESIDTLTEAVEMFDALALRFPQVTEYRREIAKAAHTLGHACRATDNIAKGLEWIDREIEIEQQLLEELPDIVNIRHKLTQGYRAKGELLAMQEQFGDAEKCFRKAISNQREVVRDVPELEEHHRHLCVAISKLAEFLLDRGRRDEAMLLVNEVIELHAALIDRGSTYFSTRIERQGCYQLRGDIHLNAGRQDEALRDYLAATEMASELLSTREADPNLFLAHAEALESQAGIHADRQEYAIAIPQLEAAIASHRAAIELRPDYPELIDELREAAMSLVAAHTGAGTPEAAVSYLDDLTVTAETTRDQRIATAKVLSRLHAALQQEGPSAAAEAVALRAIETITGLADGSEANAFLTDAAFDSLREHAAFVALTPDTSDDDGRE